MKALLDWIVENPKEAIAYGYAFLEFLNLVLPKGKGWAGTLKSKLRLLLDMATVLPAGFGTLPGFKTPRDGDRSTGY